MKSGKNGSLVNSGPQQQPPPQIRPYHNCSSTPAGHHHSGVSQGSHHPAHKIGNLTVINSVMASALKTIVSKNKRRHVEDGFNLDLSYIDERIIAMGFPAEKMESFYRNSLDEVKRFLDQKHDGKYFIYNLCSERCYDKKKFNNRVATYPFDDHHPPDFSIIGPFCKAVQEWLDADTENVAVVHCKAGKGRTGVMICCYLLHSGKFKSAQEVLQFYGQQRTVDQKGVTIPSQRRYINYYANLIKHNLQYKPVKLYLQSITLEPIPNFLTFNEVCLQFEVKQSSRAKYESGEYSVKRSSDKRAVLVLHRPLLVCGDVKIEFFSKPKLEILKTKSKEFHLWFNSFFVQKSCSSNLCHTVSEVSEEDERILVETSLVGEKKMSVTAAAANGQGDHLQHQQSEDGTMSSSKLRFLKSSTNTAPLPTVASDRHSSCLPVGTNNALGVNAETEMSLTNLLKLSSISDDHLLLDRSVHRQQQLEQQQQQLHQQQQQQVSTHKMVTSSSSSSSSGASLIVPGASATAPLSFSHNVSVEKDRRMRHSSVPQTQKSSGAMPHVSHVYSKTSNASSANLVLPTEHEAAAILNVPGVKLKMQFERVQIDKVAKDKTNKYADNFRVSLSLFRPDDQSDAGVFSSSPLCSTKPSSKSSPDSSSDDDDTTDSDLLTTVNSSASLDEYNAGRQQKPQTNQPQQQQHDQHHNSRNFPQFTRKNVFQSDWIWRQRARILLLNNNYQQHGTNRRRHSSLTSLVQNTFNVSLLSTNNSSTSLASSSFESDSVELVNFAATHRRLSECAVAYHRGPEVQAEEEEEVGFA